MITKSIFFLCFLFCVSSCAPSVYKIYDKYSDDPNFEKIEVPVQSLQILGLFSQDKEIKELIKSTKSVELVSYNGEKNANFKKLILRSLESGGYDKVLEEQEEKYGAKFYAKRRLLKVKEFHVLRNHNNKLSLVSVSGDFKIRDLIKVYKLTQK